MNNYNIILRQQKAAACYDILSFKALSGLIISFKKDYPTIKATKSALITYLSIEVK